MYISGIDDAHYAKYPEAGTRWYPSCCCEKARKDAEEDRANCKHAQVFTLLCRVKDDENAPRVAANYVERQVDFIYVHYDRCSETPVSVGNRSGVNGLES